MSLEEIKTAMFELGRHKALGPSGYTVEFFHASWDTVDDQVIAVVSDFFEHEMLL